MIRVRGGGLTGKVKITNYVQAKSLLQDTADSLAAAFATNVAKELQKNIFYTVYKRRKSRYYDRTMEFLNSVKVSKNGKYYQVQFDYKNIEPEIRRTHTQGEKPMFNAHADTWGDNEGSPFQKQLVEVLSEGYYAGKKRIAGADFLDMTEAWIKANIDDAMTNVGEYKLLKQYISSDEAVPFDPESMRSAGFKIRRK
nr:MAG TPA: hypothetical protein [Caudoviricetes sp.]